MSSDLASLSELLWTRGARASNLNSKGEMIVKQSPSGRSITTIALFVMALVGLSAVPLVAGSENHRMIILTDMLNEPDDSQTMVRLLMYANEVDIEGLIAVSGFALYPGRDASRPWKNRVHP